MKICFGREKWNEENVQRAYSHRFTETPDFTQYDDCIASAVNPEHRKGFDNISLLTREKYTVGTKAVVHCAFEGLGCPEIIFVEKPEVCDDGAVRYGACFEVVLYENGINVWRHYREDGRCFWHKRLGLEYPVAENEVHELSVEIRENYMDITLNGQKTSLRVEDMFPEFHVGITVCEGIARVYDMCVE